MVRNRDGSPATVVVVRDVGRRVRPDSESVGGDVGGGVVEEAVAAEEVGTEGRDDDCGLTWLGGAVSDRGSEHSKLGLPREYE